MTPAPAGRDGLERQAGLDREDALTRLLLVRLRQIGDVVFTTPAVSALRDHFKHCHITYLVEPAAAAVVEGHPGIDELIKILAAPPGKPFYDAAEQLFTAPVQAMMGTPSFAAWMSAVREPWLTHQKAQREALDQLWATLRLPGTAEHARLASLIIGLEGRLEGLEDRLDETNKRLAALQAIASAAKPGKGNANP